MSGRKNMIIDVNKSKQGNAIRPLIDRRVCEK